ncbi:MAG: alpha/beta hydrolase [Phycisphaerae bacterium]|jgi:pimeloyl-ACP methyl ester carboxylesterase|nr:alpha/beta hydrolase [Phycisphaerae bacterium]
MNTERFRVSFDGKSFEVAANVRRAGPDLLLLIHGLACSRDTYCYIWDRSDFAEYSVLAMDLVGFGDSDKPGDFPYTMKAQGQVVAEFLARFPHGKLHLVAHSMGGAVGLLLPAGILNSVETFANVEGNLTGDDCDFIEDSDMCSRGMKNAGPDVIAAEIIPKMRARYADSGPGYAAVDSTNADVLHRSSESLVARSDSNELLDLFDALDCRKAYFYGSRNSEHPTVKAVRDIPKVEIGHSGHFPMSDNPEDFYNRLHAFITG